MAEAKKLLLGLFRSKSSAGQQRPEFQKPEGVSLDQVLNYIHFNILVGNSQRRTASSAQILSTKEIDHGSEIRGHQTDHSSVYRRR